MLCNSMLCCVMRANVTARRCLLPGKFKWRLSTIFQRAQTPAEVSLLGFPRRRTLNPKCEKKTFEKPEPLTLKPSKL